MATFLVLQQELADRLNIDQTVAANATRLKRWLNLTMNDIASRYPFEWLYARCFVQTQVDKTAGTVAVSAGGTSVVGTSTAFAAGDKRSFIQLQGDTNWYEVTVVAGQTLTITPAFAGAALTTGTYTLRKVYYDLPADVFSIYDARQSNTPLKLTNLGVWTLDTYQPDINTVSMPSAYYTFRDDPDTGATAATQRQVGFFPCADAVYNIEFRYFMELPDLSADGDIPKLPVPQHNLMIDGAEWLGNKFLNDPNQDDLKKAYEFGIQQLIESENANGDWMPVLGSTDTQNTSRFLPFPTTYQQPR
jgi:hypothetical protein